MIQAVQTTIMIHPVLPNFISSNDTPRKIDTAIQIINLIKHLIKKKKFLESNLQIKTLKFQKFYANN